MRQGLLAHGPALMNEPKPNGAAGEQQTPAQACGLTEAIQAHQKAVLAANTRGDGQIAISPMQLFVDAELTQVKVSLLLEVLAEIMAVDPADMVVRLRDKLNGETERLNSEAFQRRLAFHSGHVPRKG